MEGLIQKKSAAVWLSVGFVVLIAASVTIWAHDSKSKDRPDHGDCDNAKIVWSPPSLNLAAFAGETKTVKVSFVSSENLRDIIFQASPQLAQFVKITPTAVEKISKGKAVELQVTLSTPTNMVPQTLDGIIQLAEDNNGKGSNDDGDWKGDRKADKRDNEKEHRRDKTFGKSLRIILSVQWQLLKDDALGFSLSYPPTYIPTRTLAPGFSQISFSEQNASLAIGHEPSLVTSIVPLPVGATLRDWVHSFGIVDSGISEVQFGGRVYLKWSELAGTADRGYISYSTLLPDGNVITFTVTSEAFANSPAIGALISSLSVSTP